MSKFVFDSPKTHTIAAAGISIELPAYGGATVGETMMYDAAREELMAGKINDATFMISMVSTMLYHRQRLDERPSIDDMSAMPTKLLLELWAFWLDEAGLSTNAEDESEKKLNQK